MLVKEAYVSWNNTTLYFCPVCRGHMIQKGQKVCEQCGTELEFPKERNYKKVKDDKNK